MKLIVVERRAQIATLIGSEPELRAEATAMLDRVQGAPLLGLLAQGGHGQHTSRDLHTVPSVSMHRSASIE